MEAGRKLDVLIAEKVFGIKTKHIKRAIGISNARLNDDVFIRLITNKEDPTEEDLLNTDIVWVETDIILDNSNSPVMAYGYMAHNHGPVMVRRYSTDIGVAWEVIEKLLSSGFKTAMYTSGALIDGEFDLIAEKWCISIANWDDDSPLINVEEEADTAPLVICLAALKVIEKINESNYSLALKMVGEINERN